MLPENSTFLVRGDDGIEYGPVDLEELREWVAENRAGLGTDVRRDEPGAAWEPWQHYPELVALLAEVTGTTPPSGPASDVIAPMGRRLLAFGVDIILTRILAAVLVVACAYYFVPGWVDELQASVANAPFTLPEIPSPVEALVEVLWDVVLVLYLTIFQAVHAMTPGKNLFRLRLVDRDGQPPKFPQLFWRSVIIVLSIDLLFLPMIFAFFNPQRRALHDIVAGTYVVEA